MQNLSVLHCHTDGVLSDKSTIKSGYHIIHLTLVVIGSIGNSSSFILFLLGYKSLRKRIPNKVTLIAMGTLLAIDFSYLLTRFSIALTGGATNMRDYSHINLRVIVLNIITLTLHVSSNMNVLFIAANRCIALKWPQVARSIITCTNFVIFMVVGTIPFVVALILWHVFCMQTYVCEENGSNITHINASTFATLSSQLTLGTLILVYNGIPGIAVVVLISLFFLQYRRSRMLVSSISQTASFQQEEKLFMRAHFIMAVKFLVSNFLPATFILISMNLTSKPVAITWSIMKLIVVLHFATTWVICLFVFPVFRKSIQILIGKVFAKKVSDLEQTLQYTVEDIETPKLYSTSNCSN